MRSAVDSAMRNAGWAVAGLLALVLIASMTGVVLGGPLDPPGPVSPTGKTLTQVEPRVPVEALPASGSGRYAISQPGSYYLTKNIENVGISNGIDVTASGVTLDLNGFALIGGAGSLSGIRTGAVTDITIRNGSISGWGLHGIEAPQATHVLVEGVSSSGNGASGMFIGNDAVLRDCSASNNLEAGISTNAGTLIERCTASGNQFDGIAAYQGMIKDCTASSNGQNGIYGETRTTISGCTLQGNTGHGIDVVEWGIVTDNIAQNNGGAGIHVGPAGAEVRIEGNDVESNAAGIHVDTAGNLIIRNTARNNGAAGITDEYQLAAGNIAGPTLQAGDISTSTNPQANYAY